MTKIEEAICKLNNLHHLAPARIQEIQDAEKELGVTFADEYKCYIKEYGVISAKGIELTGITSSPRLNVVTVTKSERMLNNNIPHNMYVVENVAIDGLVVLQNENGQIYQSSSSGSPVKIFNSLSEYINSITE